MTTEAHTTETGGVPAGAHDDPTPDGDAPDAPGEPLPLDVRFELLSNERRRRVLRYLADESPETTLGDLAEHLASIENDKPRSALSSAERKRVYICLYQCHLPKLDDADVIDFDEHRKSVTPGPNLAALLGYLPAAEGDGRPGSDGPSSFLALPAALGGLFVAQWYVAPDAWLSGVLIGALVVSVAAAALRQVELAGGLDALVRPAD